MAKFDVYEEITNRIVAQLEQGSIPWLKPWKNDKSQNGFSFAGNLSPVNAVSNRPYSGLNVLLLWITSAEKGYRSNKWLTYGQAEKLGGHVLKGEKSTLVYFMKKYEKSVKNDEGEENSEQRFMARGYRVFNVEQTSIADKFTKNEESPVVIVTKPEESKNQFREDLEKWFEATGAKFRHGGNRAFYSTGTDSITMPHLAQFKSVDSYYATKFHEIGHWTGNEKRLGRTFGKRFGDAIYALEELVAELTSAFLCADFGIIGELVSGEHEDVGADQTQQHAAYIQSWLRELKGNKKFIFAAASNARKAAEYLHSFSGKKAESEEEEELAIAA